MNIDPNDPRLTAFALGELTGDDLTEIANAIDESVELQSAVDEILATADHLSDALAGEAMPILTPEQRQRIESAASAAAIQPATATSPAAAPTSGLAKNVRFVRRFSVPIGMAASLALASGAWYMLLPSLSRSRGLSQANMKVVKLGERIIDVNGDDRWPGLDEKGIAGPDAQRTALLTENQPTTAALGREALQTTAQRGEEFDGYADGDGSADMSWIKDPTGDHRPELLFGMSHVAGAVVQLDFSGEEGEPELANLAGADLEFDHVNGQNLIRDGKGKQGAIVSQPYGEGMGLILDGRLQRASQPQPADVGGENYLVYNDEGHISGARFVPGWYDFLDRELPEDASSSRYYFWSREYEPTTPTYAPIPENPFRLVSEAPRSTFSIDVDTASYTNVRQMLNKGVLPPPGAVRIEEFINYFDYDYALPDDDSLFSVDIEVAECPWNADHRLVHIGLQGYDVTEDERPPANLVYLIDVSGSMDAPDRLPLLKQALTMLAVELTDDDSIGIVTYSDEAEVVLDATSCYTVGAIVDVIDGLAAGGSTNGGAGLEEAYAIATENFIEGGINRVILATDGGFNVGATTKSECLCIIREKAKSGVFLTVLGFGGDSLNDAMLESIADKGNGHYAFIDSLEEAERLLVDRLGGAVMTIAKDVKIQIEFNPAEVASYRLIGYENRVMPARDFNDDTKDAGEIGAGHTVTALYEIVPAGAQDDAPDVDPLVYQTELEPSEAAESGELLTIKLRYKDPDGETSELIEGSVVDEGATFAEASEDFAFAASVAGFAMLLRKSEYSGELTLEAVLEMAEAAMDYDPVGDRAEFVDLVARAIEITPGS